MIWPWTPPHQSSHIESWTILTEEDRESRINQLLDTIEESRTLSIGTLDQLDGLMELYETDALSIERLKLITSVVACGRVNPGVNHPHLAHAMSRLVNWLMKQTDWVNAEGTALEVIQWYERGGKAIAQGTSDDTAVKIHLCDIYLYQERWQDAENAIRRLKKTEPSNNKLVHSLANEKLARTLLAQGLNDEAAPILKKLIGSRETIKLWIFFNALCLQGEVFLIRGEDDLAAQFFEAAMTMLEQEGLW
ncbi:hypothetical protein CPB83DRAFT_283247 [Crepidotus variabilis]|uniref:Uncharacterized protein n=1 Tax=Crepidotus variabilis TaxID=179855 RepID=A0A9P6EGE9_9AGAR|nr:hypothetical protein CPB83DRAFT_283247 [Crepidotus variabilis]